MDWNEFTHDLGRVGGYVLSIALAIGLMVAVLAGGVFPANAIFQWSKPRLGRVAAWILGWTVGLLAAFLVFVALVPAFMAAGEASEAVADDHAHVGDEHSN